MSSVSEVYGSPEGRSPEHIDDPRRTRCRNLLIIVILLVLGLALVSGLFIRFSSKTQESKENPERRGPGTEAGNGKSDKMEHEPAEMSCDWMRQCSRKRKGTPPLLIISSDGFARRYLNEQHTPTILKMGECGGRAEHLIPSFPSKTFPNHHTIATGLHPGKHGVIDNYFKMPDGGQFDKSNGSHYGGEPIWNTAVKHGKTSKVYMWPGGEDAIGGVEASFHVKEYERRMLIDKLDTVTDWLASDDPPDLTMLYLEQPDQDAHNFGVGSFQAREAIFTVDAMLRYTLTRLHKAGVLGCINIVLLSDHGMRNLNHSEFIVVNDLEPSFPTVNLQSTYTHVHFYQNASLTSLKGKNGSEYMVYRSKEEMPLRYHYTHERIGFPFICGNPGTMKMQAIFFTIGPSIRRNVTLSAFQNIELYNLLADLLEIPAAPNDGTTGLLDEFLLNPPQREPSPQVETTPCLGSAPISGFHLASGDPNVCSKSEAGLFVLQSQHKPIALEFDPSAMTSAIAFAKREFRDSALLERAIVNLAEQKGARIQVGRFPSPSNLLFAAGFWCEGEEKAEERQCEHERDTRTEAYAIPQEAEENFNGLPLDDLLFDYRVSIADIERVTRLSLLPQSMESAVRRRVALLIANSKWK